MQQPVAIVTGAGSGIGRAVACGLAGRGWSVALAGRRKQALDQTAERIAGQAGVLVCPTDVAQISPCRELVARAVEQWGRLDGLINVAGWASLCDLASASLETWRRTFSVNVDAVFYLTQAAWPHLAKSRQGIVVNVSSVASFDPFDGLGLYGAAKAAVNMLTLVTGREGRSCGLRAVAIAPGAVETPLLRSLFDESVLPPDQTLQPRQVADLIVQCVTGERSFESGQVLTILPPQHPGQQPRIS